MEREKKKASERTRVPQMKWKYAEINRVNHLTSA